MRLFLFFALLLAPILWLISLYNTLVKLRNRFKNSYAQIDVQLNRRYDLIPNLVETAKGYMQHERETLAAVISARNTAVSSNSIAANHPEDATAVQNVIRAESQLSATLTKFSALVENYPELKADNTLLMLMEELSSTENKVSFARQAYNDAVMSYNTYREQFPNNLIAVNFNFKAAQLFEIADDTMRQPVRVSFTS